VPGQLTWSFPYSDKTQKSYSWKATYFLANGTSATITTDATTEETIVLPATAG